MQSTAVDLPPQAAPSRLGGREQQKYSQYTAFNDHRLVSHVQLLAILCTQTQISTSKCGCVFLVCVVWRRRNAGAGAPFHTSSLTDERHDTIAKSQLVTILSCLPGSARTRKLNLNQNRLSTIDPALLSRLAFLEESRLADCQLSPRQLEVVFEVTTKFGKLRKLDISGHCFKTIDISSFSLIQASEQLEELIAPRCQFSQESLEGIFSKIIGGPRLKKLNLSNALWVYP